VAGTDSPQRALHDQPTVLAPSTDAVRAPVTLPVGTVLAERFEIVEQLGEGATGVVYAARDRLLDDEVALKVLHARYEGADAELARLRAEVRAARRIAHPNVCRVHDLVVDGGYAFVAMELVRGRTLRQHLRARLSIDETLDLTRQLASALGAAHRVGVVHCDIKPENAIVAEARLVVTDFGIARILAKRAAGSLEGDASGAATIEGTPAYMAPEQFLGSALDARADVYSLAAVVFEMLAGQPPFGHLEGSPMALFRKVLSTRPALPSGVPAELSRDARQAVEAVLLRGLSRSPEERYESTEGLAAALVAAAGGHGEALARASTAAPPREEIVPRAATQQSSRRSALSASIAGRARALRRMATVVVVRVEARDDGDDEERAAERAAGFLGSAEVALTDVSGLMVERSGQAIAAVFGALGSTGDEPQRAADAARAICAAAEGVDAIAVSVAIDTGRLLVRERGLAAPAISGDALGGAQRLAAEAAPGQVRASQRTARHLARRFELTPAGGRGAVIVGDRRRTGDGSGAGQRPLVGRDREITTLSGELLAAAQQGGRGARSALVVGPAGIGKSRLRAELTDTASAAGLRVIRVDARPDHAFGSLVLCGALLRELLDLDDGAPRAEALMAARRALPTRDGEALAPELAALLGGRAPGEASVALSAAKAALAFAAAERATLIAVDDAQWSDDATLDLLESLARGEVEGRFAVLLLARPTLLERRPKLRASFAATLDLAPLDRLAAEELLALHLGARGDDLRALAETAEGNPFFIEELARDRLERGGATAQALPSTVEEVIQARLDRLGPEEREVLRAASVLGRELGRRDLAALLVAVSGAPEHEVDAVVEQALAVLVERGIVSPLPPDAGADDRYELRHALVVDVAYRELAAAERRALHAAAARRIEADLALDPERSIEHLAELGRHLEGAEERAAATSAYQRAGALAASKGAPADALRCYLRARELAESAQGSAPASALLIGLGEAALDVGEHQEAERALDAALALAEAAPDDPLGLARALLARASFAKQLARWDEAVALLRRGVALVEGHDAVVLSARLRGLLGWVLGYVLGDNEHGLPESEAAVALLEGTTELAALAGAYSQLGANYMRAGRFRDQEVCNRRNLEIGLRLGSLELTARAHLNLGVNLLLLGPVTEAAEHSRRALELYEHMRATARIALARNNLAYALVDLGQLDEAERELGVALALAERCGGLYFRVEASFNRARIAAKRGDFATATAFAREALARAEAEHSVIDAGIARRVLGDVLSLAGDHAAAARELEAAAALLQGGDAGEHARALAALARACSRRGDHAEAARRRGELGPLLERLGAMVDHAVLERDDWI
jgi:tetratricopeptide (TPR) repeat protein/predicted Ser/Thr protein kinase